MLEEEKQINLGEKLYDKFVNKLKSLFPGVIAMTPHTQRLQLFALLHAQNRPLLLNAIMLEEYQRNLPKFDLRVENNKLYTIKETLVRFK